MQNRETIVRIVLVALMIYALFSFASARRELDQTRQTVLRMEEEYESLTEENRQLEQRLATTRRWKPWHGRDWDSSCRERPFFILQKTERIKQWHWKLER